VACAGDVAGVSDAFCETEMGLERCGVNVAVGLVLFKLSRCFFTAIGGCFIVTRGAFYDLVGLGCSCRERSSGFGIGREKQGNRSLIASLCFSFG